MIQIKRGSATKWEGSTEVLESGQPGYDKTNNKIKIGDGIHTWNELSYVSPDIVPEPLATIQTAITYGNSMPTSETKGRIYLQTNSGSVEADYVVETGRQTSYFYRKWESGFVECWGELTSGNIPTTASNLCSSGVIYNVKSNNYFELKGYWK